MTELATDSEISGNFCCWEYFTKLKTPNIPSKLSAHDQNGKSILKYALVFQGFLSLHESFKFGSLLSWHLGTTFTCLPKLKLQSHLNISHRTALQEQELPEVRVVLWTPPASWNHINSNQIMTVRGPAWTDSLAFGCKPTNLLLHQFKVLCFKQKPRETPLTQLDKPAMTEIFVKWEQLMLFTHRSHDFISTIII